MIIQNLEKKIRTVTIVTVFTVVASACMVAFALYSAFSMVEKEQNQVYVLSNGIPLLAERTSQQEDLKIESMSHIEMFHQFFFTLSPDDEYMEWTLRKALYLIDESGVKQRNTLKEKGFYQNIVAASAVFSIITDSIDVDIEKKDFTYYGKQFIERPSSKLIRRLVTKGMFKIVPRTPNNPHGLLITNWRTIENEDIKYTSKTTRL